VDKTAVDPVGLKPNPFCTEDLVPISTTCLSMVKVKQKWSCLCA